MKEHRETNNKKNTHTYSIQLYNSQYFNRYFKGLLKTFLKAKQRRWVLNSSSLSKCKLIHMDLIINSASHFTNRLIRIGKNNYKSQLLAYITHSKDEMKCCSSSVQTKVLCVFAFPQSVLSGALFCVLCWDRFLSACNWRPSHNLGGLTVT